MQAIIMAAGVGSRLGKMTEDKPKSFVEIKNKKLIEYNIDLLTHHGITDIVIVVGYMYERFEALYKGRDNIRFVYNPFYKTTNVLGSFWCAQHLMSDSFIYMHADTLCDTKIFEELLEAKGDIVLPVDFGPCDEEAMKVKLDSERVRRINKSMNPSDADGEFIGIAKLSKNIVDALKKTSIQLMKEQGQNAYFEEAIQKLIDKGDCDVKVIPTQDRFWCEIDFIEDYNRAVANISEGLLNL